MKALQEMYPGGPFCFSCTLISLPKTSPERFPATPSFALSTPRKISVMLFLWVARKRLIETTQGVSMRKSDLSPQMARLLEVMQDINFGRIANMPVRKGEPEFSNETVIEREIKLAGQNGPRSERAQQDFHLKEEVVQLHKQLMRLRNGTVQSLEVKHGLPFLMRVLEHAI